jgi:NADH-quinone oxidoreductase subunit H
VEAIHQFISANFELLVAVAMPVLAVALLFGLLPLLITGERRGAAFIQDRPGPNRAAIALPWLGRLRFFGLVFNLADMGKIFCKEAFTPPFVHRAAYILAPAIFVVAILLGPAVLPWFGPIVHLGPDGLRFASGQALDADGGILVLFALGLLSVYGVVLGGWASNSKYSLLGGMRAAAVMISYEVVLGLSVLGMLLLVGDLSLTRIVAWQAAHTWGVFVQPVGFLLCVTALFTECHRTPFDVVEGDSEIVGGFHTEYGSGTCWWPRR